MSDMRPEVVPGVREDGEAWAAGRKALHPVRWPLLLYGVLLGLSGLALDVLASGLATLLLLVHGGGAVTRLTPMLIAGSAAIAAGAAFSLVDLFLLLPKKRQRRHADYHPLPNPALTVVLTAWNDEQSIAEAVRDFQTHAAVRRVIVVDNNSVDRTRELAKAAGAAVHVEIDPGYGRCVYRALREGAMQSDTELTLLCEGDLTFRAADIDKLFAYLPHAEIVNGTRIVEQLRDRETQLTTFMFYGNFAVGKLLEAKYLGQGTFTDVGTTYKLCRNAALRRLLPDLDARCGLAFNAHFLDRALHARVAVVECPITFHKRVGASKGGNSNNARALFVGLKMIKGILFRW